MRLRVYRRYVVNACIRHGRVYEGSTSPFQCDRYKVLNTVSVRRLPVCFPRPATVGVYVNGGLHALACRL